jgi:hypothetical protein
MGEVGTAEIGVSEIGDYMDVIYRLPGRWGNGKYMIESLSPDYYWEDEFFERMQMSLGLEIDNIARLLQIPTDEVIQQALDGTLNFDVEAILGQWFIRTASGQGLSRIEETLGILTDDTLTTEQRRTNALNRKRSKGISPTVQYMLSLVLKYVDDAIIIDQNAVGTHDNSFTVRILSPSGVPVQDAAMRRDLDTYKPAALAYTIQYTETDWIGMAERAWNDIGEIYWSTMSY